MVCTPDGLLSFALDLRVDADGAVIWIVHLSVEGGPLEMRTADLLRYGRFRWRVLRQLGIELVPGLPRDDWYSYVVDRAMRMLIEQRS
jgi:hypothetical protein